MSFGSTGPVLATLLAVLMTSAAPAAPHPATSHEPRTAQLPPSLRVYVLDCGTLHIADLGRFRLTPAEVATSDLSVACFLVAHPRGTLIWDTGAVPDAAWQATGAPVVSHVVLPDSQERDVTLRRTLTAQLAEIGYRPSDITYLALSHYHYDHTANANLFASATWLVRHSERDAMFGSPAPGVTQPSTYAALREAKTLVLKDDQHDVFGDGKVIIKSAPGHTQGHQVLYVDLPRTGRSSCPVTSGTTRRSARWTACRPSSSTKRSLARRARGLKRS